jgi:hypothetical protein
MTDWNHGRSASPSIHLDHAVFFGVWVESILDITLTNDAEMADDFDGGTSEHVVLVIGKCLGWRNNNGVTGMRTKGVKVLHITANDRILENSLALQSR